MDISWYVIGYVITFALTIFGCFWCIETKTRDPHNIHNDSDKEFERFFGIGGSFIHSFFWPATVPLILIALGIERYLKTKG